jgi:quinohemoprotein ethanol dehydrogenase
MYGFGVFAALDMRTNKLVWQKHTQDPCFSGMTATAGGLVFVGRNDGHLNALDSATGDKLWEFQTGAGMNAPVTVFEHDGTQYVLAYAAGNVLGGSVHGDSLWLFALNGTLEEASAPGGTVTAVQVPVEIASGNADLVTGKQSFESACLACHGADGKSGHGGADLTITKLDFNAIAETIARGRNSMPPFGAIFTPEQLRDVAGYVDEVIAKP